MTGFADSFACASRVHCRACRENPTFRARVGAPETCPHGVIDGLTETAEPPMQDRCPLRTRTCCGSPDACRLDGRNVDDGACAACDDRPNGRG